MHIIHPSEITHPLPQPPPHTAVAALRKFSFKLNIKFIIFHISIFLLLSLRKELCSSFAADPSKNCGCMLGPVGVACAEFMYGII